MHTCREFQQQHSAHTSDAQSLLDILMDFTRHRDVKCRQYAVLALGNLCTNPLHAQQLISAKCMDALVSFSFPPTTDDSVNAQFQAIGGLHGLSKHANLRVPILREGGLEPLILGARGNNRFSHVEIKREAAAALSNLALAQPNRIMIAKSGALSALVALTTNGDTLCIVHAVKALANLAESSEETHELLLTEQCLGPMCQLINDEMTHVDINILISRCLALFASNAEVHSHLIQNDVTSSIKKLVASKHSHCQRFGVLAVANLALVKENHATLMEAKFVEAILPLIYSQDIETLRGLAFSLHSFSTNDDIHSVLEEAGTVESLATLVRCGDRDTTLQACLAIKNLSTCEDCRNVYVRNHGLEPLFTLASSDDLERKRELAAALRNISLSDQNKEGILTEGGLDIVSILCRNPDEEVSHQACGVIANLSERQENKVAMMEQGILHHLQFAMLSKSTVVIRESIRAVANLSSAKENISSIVTSGMLASVIEALESSDILSRRFAAMALSNLGTTDECQVRIVNEDAVLPLMAIVRQVDRRCIDIESQQHAITCLANLAANHSLHEELIQYECAELATEYVKTSDLDLRTGALLCIANFASNCINRPVLAKCCQLQELIENLKCHERLVQLRSVTALRGLSTDVSFRKGIISGGGAEVLLSLVHTDDEEFKIEILSTLCNLSLGGCMGDRANAVLQNVDMPSLIAFLCNKDLTHRLFGAVAIGNIASHLNLQAPLFDSGVLHPLIELSESNASDVESQRCIAYAICNLSVELPNRTSIIKKGGLPSIMYLCYTGDKSDMLAALSTLRGLAASADARRVIFEEGVLHVLSLAMNAGCFKCKRELASVLVLVSLNEENKFDLARTSEMEEFVSLADSDDVICASRFCRAVGNICEISELHTDVLQVVTAERLVELLLHTDSEVALEATRCIANLTSNLNVHSIIIGSQLLANLCEISTNSNADVVRMSVLALANLCMNVELHTVLQHNVDFLSAMHNIIDCDLPQSGDEANDDIIYQRLIESKCYASMAIGALCIDPTVSQQLIGLGVVSALHRMLLVDSAELNIYVTLAFNKLSITSSTHRALGDKQVSSFLIEQTQKSNVHALTYVIASLRRLSHDDTVRADMIANDTLSFLADCCDYSNVERCREIVAGVCHLALWEKARMHIAESGMLHHLTELCKSSDVETSRFALGSLGNIAEDDQTHGVILASPEIIPSILELMRNDCVPVAREATRVLSNMLSSEAAQTTVLTGEHGIPAIVHVSELQDEEAVYNAAVSFRKLAANSLSHDTLFSQDGVNALIALTRRESTNTQLQSAAALRDVASNREFHMALKESGGIRAALELASHADIDLNIIAIGIIRHLSISMQLKVALLDSGIVNIMANCIAQIESVDLLYQCASTIANMAEHAQNKASLVEMGILGCFASLSTSGCAAIKMEAARALSLLSSAPENIVAFDKKVLPSVIVLLQCEEEETGRDGAATISNAASNAGVRALVGELGGVPPLIGLLDSPHKSCQTNACRALCQLSLLEENKLLVFHHDGLSPLIQLCSSASQSVALAAMMTLCNISTCSGQQFNFVLESGLPTIKQLCTSDHPLLRQHAAMILCNLTSHDGTQDHVARQFDLLLFVELMNDASVECQAYATMAICNLASKQTHGSAIMMAGGLAGLTNMLESTDGVQLQRSALLTLYNISTYESSHTFLAKKNVMHSVMLSCRSPDILCRRFALLIMTNVACNDKTRKDATKGGGLQAAVLALKDEDPTTMRFACICLANMANDSTTQSQIVVHGGLPSLVSLSVVEDNETRDCALMCLSNLAANESNHSPLMKQGVLKGFVDASAVTAKHDDASLCHVLGIANLTSNSEILSRIGRGGGIRPLLSLAKSDNLHAQCLALSSIRRLSLLRDNQERLVMEGIVQILVNSCKTTIEPDSQREIASCFCNLTLTPDHRLDITRVAISELVGLTKSDNLDTVRLSLCAMGNLAEDVDTHTFMKSASVSSAVVACLGRQELDIKREAARAIVNLLSSKDFHSTIIEHGLNNFVLLSASSCEECRYLTALAFRKLSPTIDSHNFLINSGLANILALVKAADKKTRKHAAITLRDISASESDDKSVFFKLGTISSMVELVKGPQKDLQIIAVATLRHLSPSECIKEDFANSGIVQSVVRCISWANDDLRCQIAGLVANLSEHRECQTTMISHGIVQGIGTLMSLEEHNEVWQVRCALTTLFVL